jgi:hypothetical protein
MGSYGIASKHGKMVQLYHIRIGAQRNASLYIISIQIAAASHMDNWRALIRKGNPEATIETGQGSQASGGGGRQFELYARTFSCEFVCS